MERHFDASLQDLKALLIGMAGYVECAVETATQALLTRDAQKVNAVYEIEKRVNQDHKAVDEACVKLLALQQPLAADLRLIVATIKINSDLERMGDQAVNIAHNTERYLAEEALKPLVDLPEMAAQVKAMVRNAIDAFVRRDLELARRVLEQDDLVDNLKDKIFIDVLHVLKTEIGKLPQGLSLILIARNLERIGDHATNIAEDVIYALTGEDIRHTPRAAITTENLKT